MVLNGKEVLTEFVKTHSITKDWIENWIADVEASSWKQPLDIKQKYPKASFVEKIVIFDVKGNSYRLEVRVAYNSGVVLVLWAGPHAEYDKRNKKR
jgi:mRNA interferase HigB